MKFMDRDGRLFGKISIIDVIVLLVVAVLVAAIYTKTQMPQTGSSVAMTRVVYQMELENLQPYMVEAIQEGDELFDEERTTNGALGKIIDIEVSDGTSQGGLSDGTYAVLPCEGRYNMVLTLEGQALVGEDGSVALNRVYDLGVNSHRSFVTKYASFVGRVLSIQIPED